MSPTAVKWARTQHTGGPSEYAVLLILAIEADRHGMCSLSAQAIADEADTDKRTVTRILERLSARGLVSWVAGAGRAPNTYTLAMSVVGALTPH